MEALIPGVSAEQFGVGLTGKLNVVFAAFLNHLDALQDVGDVVNSPLLDAQSTDHLVEVERHFGGLAEHFDKLISQLYQPVFLALPLAEDRPFARRKHFFVVLDL